MVLVGSLEVVKMYRVTFDQFLERMVIYERTPVEISPHLRRCAWLCWPVIIACSLIFYFLPDGEILRNSLFFLWTQGWMANIWNFMAVNRLLLLSISLTILGLALLLFILTRAYHLAQINLHVVLFIPVVYATASLLFVLILLLPILTNLIVWIILITLVAATCMFFMTLVIRVSVQ